MPIRLLLAVAVIFLAGCASATPELPTEKQIVVLWHTFTGTESEALQTLTDRFNDENLWDIILITEYQENINAKLEDTDTAHHPDLVVVWPSDLQAYIRAGLIGASPDMSPEIRHERGDMLPMASALYTVNGTLQALPLGLITYLMYYNLDWLSDLGYDPATATWEDLRRTACAATDPLRSQLGLGIPAHASALLAILTSGGAQITGDDGFYNFADTAGIQTATTLNDMLSGDCGIVYDDLQEGNARLSRSSLAMLVESSMRRGDIEQAVLQNRNFKLTVSPLPDETGPGPTLWYGPGLLVVAPEGARRDAALGVLNWFYSTDAQLVWQTWTDYLPVRRSLIEAAITADDTDDVDHALLQITLAAADSGQWVAWPRFTNNMTCRASLLRALLILAEGTTEPGAYINTAVTACNTGVRP